MTFDKTKTLAELADAMTTLASLMDDLQRKTATKERRRMVIQQLDWTRTRIKLGMMHIEAQG